MYTEHPSDKFRAVLGELDCNFFLLGVLMVDEALPYRDIQISVIMSRTVPITAIKRARKYEVFVIFPQGELKKGHPMHTQSLMSMVAAGALVAGLPSIVAAQGINAEVVRLQDWNYDQLYADGVSVEQLLDADVHGPTGDEIGDVENVVFGKDGKVLSIIAEIGGFLEIGDTHVNIPWDRVRVDADAEEITVPLTPETIEEYSLFADPVLTAADAATEIQEVEGDGAGVALTGQRAWRATEVIGDYARLREGDRFANYGYVDDLIIRNGEIAAVVVGAGAGWGTAGTYAYPYYGYGYGWDPGLGYYDLPYDRDEVGGLEPFNHERFDS